MLKYKKYKLFELLDCGPLSLEFSYVLKSDKKNEGTAFDLQMAGPSSGWDDHKKGLSPLQ